MPTIGSALQMKSLEQRDRVNDTDDLRQRALARLYQRMDAVNQLIQSLERYDRATQPANVLEFSAAPKLS